MDERLSDDYGSDEHKKENGKKSRRIDCECGATPQGNQVPPQVQAAVNDQVPIDPPSMTDGEVRTSLFQLGQAITTQVQAITTQGNREVPRENQHASTMANRLRDFTRMNPPMVFGSKVYEDPQDALYEVYKILFPMAGSKGKLRCRSSLTFVKEVKDSRLRKRNRESRKARSFESSSSKSRLDVQDKPKFKKRFSNQVPSNFSQNHNDKGYNPKPQKGRNVDPPRERPTYGKCGKKHVGECLVGSTSCYGSGKGGHIVKDCPNVRSHGKGNGHLSSSKKEPFLCTQG
ncbi:uncharacterized protein LOC107016711 [Solanum pennellii]|uniref:Uncharacterized protein LOC107016711 n=1 Tax=Solanum pennellii TaxID=28526 RepID=A0ABM1GKZ3_SOLPN|nr:uncharacterized protein LOC107016711 [Solanum pennellii]